MKKIATKIETVKNKVMPPLLAAYTAALLSAPQILAFAGEYDKGEEIVKSVLNALSVPILVFGAFFVIMGIVHYSAANTEGDGPAKHKAVSQIAGGAMVVVVGIAMKLPIIQNIVTSIFE